MSPFEVVERGGRTNVSPFMLGLDGLGGPPSLGIGTTPQAEAAAVAPSSWGGMHGIAGASEEGPGAFEANVLNPLEPWLMPQGPFDTALALGLGPVRWLRRPAMMAAGALLGLDPGEAEGSLLSPKQVDRLRRVTADQIGHMSARPEFRADLFRGLGDDAAQSQRRAEEMLMDQPAELRRIFTEPYQTHRTPAPEVNAAFQEYTPQSIAETGWFPYPRGASTVEQWRWLAPTQEPERWFQSNSIQMGGRPGWNGDTWRPALPNPQAHVTDLDWLQPLIDDSMTVIAAPDAARNTLGVSYYAGRQNPMLHPNAHNWGGYFSAADRSAPAGAPESYNHLALSFNPMRRSERDVAAWSGLANHELQHLLQYDVEGRFIGTEGAALWHRIPRSLQDEYTQSVIKANPNLPPNLLAERVRDALYMAHPLEWEARLAGEMMEAPRINQPVSISREALGPWPDFRLW